MDPGDNDEPSREELESRVAELEANQAEQREWWQDALPSRRGVLTAGAGLGLGALLSGSASGQSAAGQVGTPSSPEDVYAYDIDVQGALQRDLDAGGQAISNVGSVSTDTINNDIYLSEKGGLQEAITAADSGDRVIVDSNDTVDSPITPKSDITIRGQNGATITAGSALSGGIFFDTSFLSNFTVKNVAFDGGGFDTRAFRVNASLNNVDFINNQFDNFGLEPIYYFTSPTDCRVEDNLFKSGNTNTMFRCSGGADGLYVRNNVLESTSCLRFIWIENNNGASQKIRITGNTSRGEPTNRSIRVLDASDVWIDDNYVTSAAAAFDTSDTGGSGDNISVSQVTDVKIRGNTVLRSGDQGIGVENAAGRVIIANNEVRETNAAGIYITASAGAAPERVKVIGNEVKNSLQNYGGDTFTQHGGIRLAGSVTNCKIVANDSYNNGDSSTNGYGISFDPNGNSDENIVTNNDFSDNQTGAVENAAGANSIVTNNLP